MAGLEGITQSVNRAHRLMQDTGFMDASRALSTEAWDRNISEARRELNEAADTLAGRDGSQLYLQMSSELRQSLWRATLLSSINLGEEGSERFDYAIGRRIMRSTGASASSSAQADLNAATNFLASQAKGFPTSVLRVASRAFHESAPTEGAEIERRARLAGDPIPIRPAPQDTIQYMRITLNALTRAHAIERSWEAQNPGITAFVAMAAAFFGVPTGDPSGQAVVEYAASQATSGLDIPGSRVSSSGTVERIKLRYGRSDLVGSTPSAGLMKAIGYLQIAQTGIQTYARLTNPQERMRQCIQAAALAASNNELARANVLIRKLETTEQQMNMWMQWVNRHRDHPAYVPPGGVVRSSAQSAVRLN